MTNPVRRQIVSADDRQARTWRRTTPPWIAYVGPFPYPWGQAGSRRVHGVARSIVDAGYDVVVASGSAEPPGVTRLLEGDAGGILSHIGLAELPQSHEGHVAKMKKVLLTWGRRTATWLEQQSEPPSHVIVYGGSAQYMHHVGGWCRRRDIPLIVDVVEWYNHRQLMGGLLGPVHISAKIALRFQYPRASGVIAISSLLEQRYANRGCSTLRIPPTLDVESSDTSQEPQRDGKLHLAYCGTPGKKDLLANLIAGVEQVDPNGDHLTFHVVGPSRSDVETMLQRSDLPPAVNVVGRRQQQEVAQIVKNCDFTVLLREPLLFAQAGFPTKFCESLSAGTPVIANLTSDLGTHLRDGREGLVCADHSTESLVAALTRALTLDASQKAKMREAARSQALEAFDFRRYSSLLKRFLADVQRS